MSRASLLFGAILGLAALAACTTHPPADRQTGSTTTSLRESVCLNGEWDFRAAGTSAAQPPADGWRPMRVPASWGESGRSCFALSAAELASPQAWHGLTVAVPAGWAGDGRVLLRLGAVVDGHRILVNGATVAESDRLALCAELDITAQVRFGAANRIEVMTRAFAPAPDEDPKLARPDRGIIRDVALVHAPAARIAWSHAITSVRDRTITVRTRVVNTGPDRLHSSVAVHVLDNGREVLALPQRPVEVPPGGEAVVESSAPWADPVLWGFGEYGTPKLYTLRSELGASDRLDDRFGFREFRVDGERFLLNGRPLFLKGDLTSRRGIFPENPSYITAYYQRLRDGGMNLQRMHSGLNSTFDDPAWYAVADEVGMLVEGQLTRFTTGGKVWWGDAQPVRDAWAAYVAENFNHPSLVLWSIDNETFSVLAKDIPSLPVERIRSYDRLSAFVRALDPTRVVEIHHDWTLFPSLQRGDYARDSFTTFNIHPYGKIDAEMLQARRTVGFDRSVPTVVGEIYTFPKNIDPVLAPATAFGEQMRKLKSYTQQLRDAAAVPGVASTILCAMMADGWVGFTAPGSFHLGPWTGHAVIADAQGRPAGRREFNVEARWPSLSGTGVKAEFIGGYHLYWATGFGLNLNWFDPAQPIWRSNLVDAGIRDVFAGMPGGPAPALGPERSAEVVVGVACDGRPAAGAQVQIIGEAGQAGLGGVACDRDGTAWFRIWETGRYRARCTWQGRTLERAFTIAARPRLGPAAGYGHVQWVGLGGFDPAAAQARLSAPAEFRDDVELRIGDAVVNGGLEAWREATPQGWNGRAERSAEPHGGGACARIAGPKGQLTTPLKLDRGRTYTLRGWIRPGAGTARLVVKSGSYAQLAVATAAGPGGWRQVEAPFTATGDGYLYAEVLGADGSAWFDDLQVLAGPPVEAPPMFDPGPWAVSPDGFIRTWLALGPVPNRLFDDGTYEGFATDWFAGQGGETAARPVFGGSLAVDFPAGGYWTPGPATLRWRQLASPTDRVVLSSLGLPAIGISDQDPCNVAAYLACTVISPDEREARIAIGSDDGYTIWLDGVRVAALSVSRGSKPDQETWPVRLRRGPNRLMLKVFQDSGGWNCWLRLLAADGAPMRDLEVGLEGEAVGARCLTPGGGGRPLLLADGRTLVHERLDEQGRTALDRVDLRSGARTRIGDGSRPLADADGGLLCLRGDPAAPELVRIAPDGRAAVLPPTTPRIAGLCARLDVQRLVVATAAGLHVLDTTGATPAIAPWPPGIGAEDAAVSPDGRLAALVAPGADGIPGLRVVELASGRTIATARPVPPSATGRVGGNHSPCFSPDGSRIAFVRAGIQPDADIVVLDLASGRETPVTADRARNRAPCFSADGRRLAFSAVRDGDREQVWLVPAP